MELWKRGLRLAILLRQMLLAHALDVLMARR
jgi:hypothetical protein